MSAADREATHDRVGWIAAVGLGAALYSHFYDRYQLPPRLPNAPGLILAGDVLPLLVVPALFVVLVLREPLRRYGFAWPGAKRFVAGSLAAWLALLPFVLWLSARPEFQAFYPSPNFPTRDLPLARMHVNGLFALWLLAHLPQLFATEFCFRGFLLFPFARAFGVARAIAILAAPYVLLHWTKPPLELAQALWGGVVFGLVAWRTGSFLPAFASHWLVAVTMDWLCFRALHP